MKRSFITVAIVVATATIAGCSHQGSDAPVEKSAEPESQVRHGPNGEVVITLDAATQKVMGLQVAALGAKELSPEVKSFGRVVDPSTLAEILIELDRAQRSYDNAHAELERMKVLRKDNNASERAFQTAVATYEQNLADVNAVRLRIQKNFGAKVAELPGPVVVPPGTERKPNPLLNAILGGEEVRLIRADLPASEDLQTEPAGARVVANSGDGLPIQAIYFGSVPAVDLQTQMHGYFFLVPTNRPNLTPGMALTAYIQTYEPAQSGMVVPRHAVVRFNGATWIYLQTSEETFQRVAVTLDRPLADGWFVREGLKPESKIVTVGAQIILSTEMSAAGFSDGEHH